MDPVKYLEESGVLKNLSESEAKNFFFDTFEKYKDGDLSKDDFAKIISELLYQHIYDQEVEIKDSGLISAMELSTELLEVDEKDSDFSSVLDPIEEYISNS